MAFPTEEEAFTAYADAMPNNCILLVDTYDTVRGVKNAIEVGKKLRAKGHELTGIRLDSGDLADLSIRARKLLDEAGFSSTKIVASDSLDEYAIEELKARGAQIDIWGIGTNLVTAKDQPALGGVYKLAALQNEDGSWSPKIKRSETAVKTSNPGRLGVTRYFNADGVPLGSIMHNELQAVSDRLAYVDEHDRARTLVPGEGVKSQDLLAPIFQAGTLVYDRPPLETIRINALRNWKTWAEAPALAFGLSPELHQQKADLLTTYK